MSNNNIVIKLHDSLSKATAQKLYPTDIAFLLGYGATQIKDYFKFAKKGKISKPNKRLERAALLAYRLGKVEGFETLFPLIPKLAGDLDDAEWMNRTARRMDKMLRVDQSIVGQLDLIEESKKPENDDQIKLYFGYCSPLALNMIESDISQGHISENYDALIEQLYAMFGKKGHYEFAQVKAALVALECPDMVGEVASAAIAPKVCEKLVVELLSHKVKDSGVLGAIALNITKGCDSLEIKGVSHSALESFVRYLSVDHPRPDKLKSLRVMKAELHESEFIQEFLPEHLKPENDDQTSCIMWPSFVTKATREALNGFEPKALNWALSHKGEKVVSRLLAGYVKEANALK
ncbi:hypothetical protein BCS71_25740 [Vibrio lentus]|uniref:hypothetical protein n=1 Tax=Vibrio lentus TaxID=136468 RepID=UPI000C85C2E8|nr:hypothetical protein [Vibrio lentus]PMI58284.1 hypothetical protein BCU41_03890 [Vibrio lentus]